MKNTPERIKVMIVDDHRVVSEGLAMFLKATGFIQVCGIAGNLAEAFDVFRKARPDVVVLDLNLGGGESGFTFLEKVKSDSATALVRVVVVSTFDDETFRSHARLLGADDYVAKGSSTNEIVAAIRHAVEAPPARPGGGVGGAGGASAGAGREKGFQAEYASLSPNERRTLRLLIKGLSQKEIAAQIGVSASTVGTYVQRARDKFNARSLSHLVSMVEALVDAKEGK